MNNSFSWFFTVIIIFHGYSLAPCVLTGIFDFPVFSRQWPSWIIGSWLYFVPQNVNRIVFSAVNFKILNFKYFIILVFLINIRPRFSIGLCTILFLYVFSCWTDLVIKCINNDTNNILISILILILFAIKSWLPKQNVVWGGDNWFNFSNLAKLTCRVYESRAQTLAIHHLYHIAYNGSRIS